MRRLWWRVRQLPGPPPGITQADAEALFGEGMELIDQNRLESAARIGRRLIGMRFTGGYELLATVQNTRGDREGAISTLSKGLSKKPVWRLANLLGNYLSDAGQYEAALEIYHQSAGMFGDQSEITELNKAIALSRADRDDDARLTIAHLIDQGPFEDPQFGAKVRSVARDLGVFSAH
jgi:tetratricopeptide (TPR) repeat protein